jgi:hypothetical protein
MLGEHIRARKGDRWLHGIDLGDQRILFLDEQPGLPPADRLRRVYRPEFTAGSSRVETVVHRERAYPAKMVVARAWSRFMDPTALAALTTSQQFAEWCKVGRIPAAPEAVSPAAPTPAPRPAVAPAAAPAPKAAQAAPKPAVKAKAVAKAPAKAKPALKAKASPAAKKPVKESASRPAAKRAAPQPKAQKNRPKAPARKPASRSKPAVKAKPQKRKARR